MAYTTDTNNKILFFLNKAQTKIGIVSVLVADKVSEDSRFESYRDELEIAYGLLSFIRSLDNIFNNWTESEIINYIDKWTAKANLNPLPYIIHTPFNNRICFTGDCGGGSTPSTSINVLYDDLTNLLYDDLTSVFYDN